MRRPDRWLIAAEAAVGLVAGVLVALVLVAVWLLAVHLPLAIVVLLVAAPLGAVVRVGLDASDLIAQARGWHERTKSRLITTATYKRWDEPTDADA